MKPFLLKGSVYNCSLKILRVVKRLKKCSPIPSTKTSSSLSRLFAVVLPNGRLTTSRLTVGLYCRHVGEGDLAFQKDDAIRWAVLSKRQHLTSSIYFPNVTMATFIASLIDDMSVHVSKPVRLWAKIFSIARCRP